MTDRQFQLGNYLIEPLAGVVRRADGDESTHLQPMVMNVLTFLAERQGEVVKRDELIDGVWGRAVSDEVLTRAIHELRVVLKDQGAEHSYIETMPKVGYRLLKSVTELEQDASPTDASDSRHSGAYRLLAKAGIGIVVLMAIFAIFELRMGDEPTRTVELRRVVLASFEDFTGDSRLERALDIAFRTGIEQSQQISIFPPNAVASSLERMQIDPDTPIDRDTAIEISLRGDADTVIVGAIASVGDSYRVTGEIIEPQSGETVFSHQSTVASKNNILEGLDEVVAAIRRGSGETQLAIDENTAPLEKVTTANFEALEAYSIGMRRTGLGDLEGAIPFFQEAIRLDAEFAMAYAKLGLLQLVASDVDSNARVNLQRALGLSDRLTRREQLYVSALVSFNDGTVADMRDTASLLVMTFPRYVEGHRMLGNIYRRYDNDYEKAVEHLTQAVEIPDPMNAVAHYNLGWALLAQSRYKEALDVFGRAREESGLPMSGGLGLAHITVKEYAAAEDFLQASEHSTSAITRQMLVLMSALSNLDQGKFEQAMAIAKQAGEISQEELGAEQRSLVSQCAILERSADRETFLDCLQVLIDLDMSVFEEEHVRRRYWPAANLAQVGIVAARNGQSAVAEQVFESVHSNAMQTDVYPIRSYASILEAELLILNGRVAEAINRLKAQVADRALYQAHESLARAYRIAGDNDGAIDSYRWMIDNRGQAFAEDVSRSFGTAFHVLDWAAAHVFLAELHERAGRTAEALELYEALIAHWQDADNDISMLGIAVQRAMALTEVSSAASP